MGLIPRRRGLRMRPYMLHMKAILVFVVLSQLVYIITG